MMQVVFDHYDMQVYYDVLCKFTMMCYASLLWCVMQVHQVMLCKFIKLCYASSSSYFMQVWYVMICKFTMLCFASLSCYDMQVYHVMLCKFAMLWYASLPYDMQVMLCKFGLIILLMLSCYASLSWVYELKASSFMLKVAFWQHVSYHISYDNLHVRLNANLWQLLHVIYHHVSLIC